MQPDDRQEHLSVGAWKGVTRAQVKVEVRLHVILLLLSLIVFIAWLPHTAKRNMNRSLDHGVLYAP